MATRLMDSPALAEEAFYKAFERGEVDAMMAVWAASPDISCVHPMGPLLTGPAAIRSSWQEIFRAQLPRRFEIDCLSRFEQGDLAVHVLHETIILPLHRQRLPTLITTNIYRKESGVWRMVMHHASVIGSETVEVAGPAAPPATRH
ncbi:MAG: nuclear transport factor 2 family protein [Gammaproteobacteria bacterium]|nr:nuclear transport factor 2 family protein [Gammaproteobacteria bacterium]